MNADNVDAPIVAVTVYPDRARVTRRGTTALPAGEHRLRLGPLPTGLHRDSLRVGGRGHATILGVDLVTRRQPRSTDEQVRGLEERRAALTRELTEIEGVEAVEARRTEFLTLLSHGAGRTYARNVASGTADVSAAIAFADSMVEQFAAGQRRQQELTRRRAEIAEAIAMVDRQLDAIRGKRAPDQLFAEVTVSVDAQATPDQPTVGLELDLTYVVSNARWSSTYDLRLVDETIQLTWIGLVSQETGEDWPECQLQLSTAQPSMVAAVPSLRPWFLGRIRPVPVRPRVPMPVPMPDSAIPGRGAPSGLIRASQPPEVPAPPMQESVAEMEQGLAAAVTYRSARPVAVPADGTVHRVTVAVLELPATLDYVTVPVREPVAHLRATVRNTSPHTFVPGPAAVFHGTDFVSRTSLRSWVPGEEVELTLGIDDRVRVERKLTRRSASRAALGSVRRRDVEYAITVTNHLPQPATVTVLDQLPISRDEGVVVRELQVDPEPTRRIDLGELNWRLQLDPGAKGEITFGFRVEVAREVELDGWRD